MNSVDLLDRERLVATLAALPDRGWADFYLRLVGTLLSVCGATEDDPRVALTSPESPQTFLPVNFGVRYVLCGVKVGAAKHVAVICGPEAVRHPDFPRHQVLGQLRFGALTGEEADTMPYLVRLARPEHVDDAPFLRAAWLDAARAEYERCRRTPYWKFHVPLLYKAATDEEVRRELLEDAWDKPIFVSALR